MTMPTTSLVSGRGCAAMLLALLVSACATGALDRAPASPDHPWRPSPELAPHYVAEPARSVPGVAEEFSVPPVSGLEAEFAPWVAEKGKVLDLGALIDIAQRQNPQTRQAWNHAREAALAVGMAEATFLPMLSANVLTGHQRTRVPSPLVLGDRSTIETDVSGVVPALALQWLLFDFGEREALVDTAKQLSFVANVLFNAAHQKTIHDVSNRYYQYHVARWRVEMAEQALGNLGKVEQAVRERIRAGMATRVDLAIARQGVAQARLQRTNAQGLERNAYLALLSAAGLPPTAQIAIADLPERSLPAPGDPMTDRVLEQALGRRADIVAGYAALKAAQAGVRAAEAEFMPKIYLGAVAARNRSHFDVRGLPELSQHATSSGVLLGMTLPLFDGGLRSARLRQEQIRVEDARDTLEARRRDALREMVAADMLLRSALESHQAASELVRAAATVYDAALEAYRHGVGTITAATEAATALLEARQARTDAYGASLSSAASLAFFLGNMTSARDSWLPGPADE